MNLDNANNDLSKLEFVYDSNKTKSSSNNFSFNNTSLDNESNQANNDDDDLNSKLSASQHNSQCLSMFLKRKRNTSKDNN